MKLAVAGTGYVGLSLAVLLAQHNEVVAVDVLPERVALVNDRKSTIQDEYIEQYLAEKQLHLSATLDAEAAYRDAEFVIIAAPTNYDSEKNFFDTSAVESAATTLDIYTHSTSDMQHAAARKIDCGIGKAGLPDEPAPQANAPAIVDFQPYMGKVRKPGTGCISQINDHLFEGRYSPTWIDGKKHARNVYAHTREECEEKLKVLIAEMKAELAELKRQKGDRH